MKIFSPFFLIIYMVLNSLDGQSQISNNGASVRVKDGANISSSIPYGMRYVYPQFLQSTITFKSGKTAIARMNYNLVHGEIQFIAPNGDTLLLADPETIAEVAIGYDLYYFLKGEGHVEQVMSESNLILTKKELLTYSGSEKYASYGQYSSTGAITNITAYAPGSGGFQKLGNNSMTVLIRKASFFLIDKNQKFYPATRSSLFRIFPKHKKELTIYFDENTINFDNEDQLKDLVAFCADFN